MRREKGTIIEALFSLAEYDIIYVQELLTDLFNPYTIRYRLIRGLKESKTAIYLHKNIKKTPGSILLHLLSIRAFDFNTSIFIAFTRRFLKVAAVSYTHLTLPTICSV